MSLRISKYPDYSSLLWFCETDISSTPHFRKEEETQRNEVTRPKTSCQYSWKLEFETQSFHPGSPDPAGKFPSGNQRWTHKSSQARLWRTTMASQFYELACSWWSPGCTCPSYPSIPWKVTRKIAKSDRLQMCHALAGPTSLGLGELVPSPSASSPWLITLAMWQPFSKAFLPSQLEKAPIWWLFIIPHLDNFQHTVEPLNSVNSVINLSACCLCWALRGKLTAQREEN